MAQDEVKVVRTKAYKINRSNGDDIPIDEDELPKFIQGMATGTFMFFRQGGANPSYVTGITPDKDRIRAWLDECSYGHGQGEAARLRGMKPLKDILGLPEVAKQLQSTEGFKQLGNGK